MSIVRGEIPRANCISRLEKLAGTALIAAAAFVATPKIAHADTIENESVGGTSTNPNSANAVSWFNVTNWGDINLGGNVPNTGPTGTLPENSPESTGGTFIGQSNAGMVGTLVGMPSVGVVFDPADDSLTPGGPNANYVANLYNTTASLFVGSLGGQILNGTLVGGSGTITANPSKLTVLSGTIIVGGSSSAIGIGRDEPGILVQNGGTLICQAGGKLEISLVNKSTNAAQGTFEYHGGTLKANTIQMSAAAGTSGASETSASVSTFIVYNDGPAGAILSSNGFQMANNTKGVGAISTVEFHYDLNTGGVGGVRPVQGNWNNGFNSAYTQSLILNNGTKIAATGTASLAFTYLSSRLNLVLDAAPSIINGRIQNLGLFDETIITGNASFPKAFSSADGSTVFTQGATISAVVSGSTYSWTISYSGQINFTSTAVSGYNTKIGLAVPEPSTLTLLGGAGSLILARRRGRKPPAGRV
ncbi:MAG: PEP-CTERM sorting domain-containing protein [Tepidisphaeraceae bacterium]